MGARPANRSTARAAAGAPGKASSKVVSTAAWPGRAGHLLRIDGAFEGLLGALMVLSPVVGLDRALALPWPLVVAAGIVLLPLLPILWRMSRAPRRHLVLALAGANGVGALVFAGWVALRHGAFTGAGAAFVLIVAAILAALAALQTRAALMAT